MLYFRFIVAAFSLLLVLTVATWGQESAPPDARQEDSVEGSALSDVDAVQQPEETKSPAQGNDEDADLSPVARLAKFYWDEARDAMGTELRRLDNYSCIHHINRYTWSRRGNRFERVDTVRLQVSYVDGQEYFARLGSSFMVKDPSEVVSSGMIASGFFKGFASSLFLNQSVEKLVFRGVQEGPEQNFLRYQFETNDDNPLRVRVGTAVRDVQAKGEFWLDKDDQKLRRVVVENREAIGRMGLRRVLNIIDWAPVSTSAGLVLLPQRADLWMVSSDGNIDRNEVTLAQCREYRAESSIRFDGDDDLMADTGASEPEDDGTLVDFGRLAVSTGNVAGVQATIAASKFLPGGVSVSLVLRQSLSLDDLRVGETFTATVEQSVTHQGKTLIPSGTLVEGRVRRLDRLQKPVPHTVLWLEFPVIRSVEDEYTFLADIVRISEITGLANTDTLFSQQRPVRDPSTVDYIFLDGPEPGYRPVAGVAGYVFREEPPTLPTGHRIEWRTIKPE
jgi:hypothetical protein